MNNNLFYIDHSESLKQRHQNGSRLHLNAKSIVILAKTFLTHISNNFNWQPNNCTAGLIKNEEYMSSSPYIDNLNFIRKDNLNKTIYYSTSEHSSKNKFEYLIKIYNL